MEQRFCNHFQECNIDIDSFFHKCENIQPEFQNNTKPKIFYEKSLLEAKCRQKCSNFKNPKNASE